MNSPATHLPEFAGVPANHRKEVVFFMFISLIFFPNPTNSQSSTDDMSNSSDSVTNFQPSLAVVVGVLSIMFSLTFLLLIYAKCCHRSPSTQYLNHETLGHLPRSMSRLSGVDKTVIESLPFFRFSTLKGWRDGLECAICLSRFEDVEILRLLPQCKHAFHIDCVDRWLEKHSGCPLCRCRVGEDDATLFALSSSLRFHAAGQSVREPEGSDIELFVEREGSARFGSGRIFGKVTEDHVPGDLQETAMEDPEVLHKFNHRIILSSHGPTMKNRWSNVSSSELMFLRSEMVASTSSNRLDPIVCVPSNRFDPYEHEATKIKAEVGRKVEFERKIKRFSTADDGESKEMEPIEKRSMSEIIVHPRFLGVEETGFKDGIGVKEERLRRLWLPIARRTVQWFVNRERRSEDHGDQQPHVNTKSENSV